MKYVFNLRTIAREGESIIEKHSNFIQQVANLAAPWNMSGLSEAPDAGAQLSARISTRKCFGPGFGDELIYQYRRPFRNEAAYDDFLWLEFNPKKIDHEYFIAEVAPAYIRAFDAYFAEYVDRKTVDSDFDARRERRHNQRVSVFRLSPMIYMSERLCESAFGIGAAEVVRRLEGRVESVRAFHDGVFVLVTSLVMPGVEALGQCEECTQLLHAK